jgi:ABC-2 type transport system ATP-binding protein
MKGNVIEANSLSKSFKTAKALDGVSLEVGHGEKFFLLGPNGSGKTTMINCFLSLMKPNTGVVKLFGGLNPAIAKKKIGVIMEEDGFFRDLSAEKNLQILCHIKGVGFEVIPELLEKVDLWEHRKKMAKKLSQGMRKRLAIASSLVGNPDLYIWDEPYNGLDPSGFKFIRDLMDELFEDGKTIFVSTHLLDEVSKSATRVGLLFKGNLLNVQSKDEIHSKYGSMENFYFKNVKG